MKRILLTGMMIACTWNLSAYAQMGGMMNKAKNAAAKSSDSKDSKAKPDENKAPEAKPADKPAEKPADKPAAAPKKEVVLGKYSEIPAGMQNKSFEDQAVKLVMEKATAEHWNEKYTKAKIVSKDWEIEKNDVTGRIICRKIYMKLYGTWPNGKCKSVDFGFKQDYAGGDSYSKNLIYNGIGDMTEVVCE